MWYCWVQWKPFHQREREREVRGQIGVRRVLLASDEATPYSGLEARHLPLLAGLAAARAGASYLLPARCGRPRKLHMWRSCGFPGASLPPDPSLLSTHIHTIWNNTNRTEMDCTTRQPCTTHPNVGLKDETGFQRMAASPGTELMSPASPPTTSQPSHLKAYPYLFVRETDQVSKL